MVRFTISTRTLIIGLASSLLGASGFAQQLAYESPAGTKFLLYTPPAYSSDASAYPLLLSLHSKGEVGDDLTELTSRNPEQMPSRLIYLNRWPQDLPFIVLTPQLNLTPAIRMLNGPPVTLMKCLPTCWQISGLTRAGSM